jgi:cyanate lyase
MLPRTQNPVQNWQLRKRLSGEQAAQRIGISADRYCVVVVFGKERFTEDEIRQVLAATGIAEDRLRAWEQRPQGDTRNPPAR